MCAEELLADLIEVQLGDIADTRVGHRPDRVEPRAIKRRPKPHKLLTEPRQRTLQSSVPGLPSPDPGPRRETVA